MRAARGTAGGIRATGSRASCKIGGEVIPEKPRRRAPGDGAWLRPPGFRDPVPAPPAGWNSSAPAGYDRNVMENIYLDHAATAPTRDEVWAAMASARGEADYNAASTHAFGRAADDRLEGARRTLADVIGVSRSRVRFTGGGTASDNLAVLGFARAHAGSSPVILVSEIEHRAVLAAARRAGSEGADVTRLPVDGTGRLRLDALERELARRDGDRPTLVSVMWANNEIGTVQPVGKACEMAHAHGALFHTDAVQALGKVPVSLEDVPADLLTATAHKLGGPVGIGLLVTDGDTAIEPLFYGGEQERGTWPGTQNPVAAVGFAEAARLAAEDRDDRADDWSHWRAELEECLRDRIGGLRVRGAGAPDRLPHLLNVGVPGCDQAELLVSLDMEGIAVSSGSACSSGAVEPSHVLEALGEPPPDEAGTIRISFGPSTTREHVRAAADAVVRVVDRLRGGAAAGAAGSPAAGAPAAGRGA